jgi:hypothetical protein
MSDWKLVPVEPTLEMLRAGQEATEIRFDSLKAYSKIWYAMLAAAPPAPQQEPVADQPREVLLGKSLRQHAHAVRIETCAAWSDVAVKPIELDEAKCQYARAQEERLRSAIDELADLSAPPDLRARVAELERQLEATEERVKGMTTESASWRRTAERVEEQKQAAEARVRKARDLLAVIHKDGGHHTEKVGFEQSVEDAIQIWAGLP